MRFICIMFLLSSALLFGQTTVSPDAVLLRFPDISQTHITFVYGGDIWVVERNGGLARRITSVDGFETAPKFSPDGKTIAFTGNYDGNPDIYLIPSLGGSPKRLTHHPANDVMVEWYPDGKQLLFRSPMTTWSYRIGQFWKQPIEGGIPEMIPLPYGERASFNADASKMVYQFNLQEGATWKRYHGGSATDLWLYDFKNNTSEKLTDYTGNDGIPMWSGNSIYFLSDRDANSKLNIWAYDITTKQVKQITFFTEYDVKWPSLGNDAIVFENGGKIYVLSLADGKSTAVSIQVPDDAPKVRLVWKDLSQFIGNFSISPNGKRALFSARGEVLTIPAKDGSPRNLTNSSGVAERDASWSPDGNFIAYFSDKEGEYDLYIRPADGTGEEKRITNESKSFRFSPIWSPDSKLIAFRDKAGNLFIAEVASGSVTLVDKNDVFEFISYSWSPDSKWLTYGKSISLQATGVFIYNVADKTTKPVTDEFYSSNNPVFSTDGKYLFFSSDRTFSPLYSGIDGTWIYPNATNIYAVMLSKDTPSLLAIKSDEQDVKKEGDTTKVTPPVVSTETKIDFEGIQERIVKLPIPNGNYGGFYSVAGKLIFASVPLGAQNPASTTIKYYDIEARETKDIITGVGAYDVSAGGDKIIYTSNGMYGIIGIEPGKNVGDGVLDLSGLKAQIDIRKEWNQIFFDAWRIEKDYFYDPGMHGVDWNAIYKRYSALVPYIYNRNDLNYLIGEMIGELNASHTYVGGGDIEQAQSVQVGLLGCDFTLDNGYYRISKIYKGASHDYADVRSPLTEPGAVIAEGEYLIAVNRQPVNTKEDPWAAFQNLAGKVVTLTVNTKPSKEGARDVIVKPISDESELRYFAELERNRKIVDEATDGQIGYIYVPNTGVDGQNELVRQFIGQISKKGFIIDERFNAGGQIPDRFIELLSRKALNYWARRDFVSWATPFPANAGPKVMLINGWSGSGGDAFPYYFKQAKLGPVVGKRTWGGLIGYSGNPGLIDGGFVTAPTFGFYDTEGKWDIEGYGVDPDYEVENTPSEMVKGRDPQLEKAIELVKEALKREGTVPQKPEYPKK